MTVFHMSNDPKSAKELEEMNEALAAAHKEAEENPVLFSGGVHPSVYHLRPRAAPNPEDPQIDAIAEEPVDAIEKKARKKGVSEHSKTFSERTEAFLSRIRMTANHEEGCVDYVHLSGKSVAFHKFDNVIKLGHSVPDEDTVLAMLEIGAHEFGPIEVFGTPEFVEFAVQVALEHGIVLQNKEYTAALSKSAERQRTRG